MKGSTQFNLIHIAAASFGFVALFHTILGVPRWLGLIAGLIFVICILITWQLVLRAIKRGEHTFPAATSGPKRKHLWLFPLLLCASCFGLPFVLPDTYGSVTLALRERVIIAGTIYVIPPTLFTIMR